jgi:hypothetical protein
MLDKTKYVGDPDSDIKEAVIINNKKLAILSIINLIHFSLKFLT